jgi:hypothetical protein
MIIYIPVAAATYGGVPMLNNIGLKIEPPPSPKAPEINPPKRPRKSNFVTLV